MDKYIKTLFNDGKNTGDITIKCVDDDFTCHSFVVCNVCPVLERMVAYAQKANSSTIGTEFTTKTMRYLISMLYDSSLGEIKVFERIIFCESDTKGKLPKLHLSFVLEYIRARDYFGIQYGIIDEIPASASPAYLIHIVSSIPDLPIYLPLQKTLYERIYDDLCLLDLESEFVKIAFKNPSISITIAGMYKKKLLENVPMVNCRYCGKKGMFGDQKHIMCGSCKKNMD